MSQVDHGKRKHALLSASGASRWMACTPSARLEEDFPEQESSVYAREGTLAHEFGDIELRLLNSEITKAAYKKQKKKLEKHELFSEEMPDEVQKYVDYVWAQFTEAKRKDKHAILLIEQKLDLSAFIEEGFGTGDATIISNGTMEVADLKYGKGVPVFAEDNPQLKLYGLGALQEHDLSYDIHTVKLTVIQPRLNSISSWEIDAIDLRNWGENDVRKKAAVAYEGGGELVPGEHCKWCKAKNRCPAIAEFHMGLAKHDFAEPALLSDKDLIKIYEQTPQLIDWANSIASYMLEEALNGREWKGYKLVEGRSNRKWVDEDGAIKILKKEGHPEEKIVNVKIKGIGDIEKLVKKKNFPVLLGDCVDKPQGKPSLVPESDNRPALGVEQAAEDFTQ